LTTLAFADAAARSDRPSTGTSISLPKRSAGIDLVQLHDALWRITRPTGEVLGYVEKFSETAGDRYRAKRMIVTKNRFVSIGEFWSADDAVECFRLG